MVIFTKDRVVDILLSLFWGILGVEPPNVFPILSLLLSLLFDDLDTLLLWVTCALGSPFWTGGICWLIVLDEYTYQLAPSAETSTVHVAKLTPKSSNNTNNAINAPPTCKMWWFCKLIMVLCRRSCFEPKMADGNRLEVNFKMRNEWLILWNNDLKVLTYVTFYAQILVFMF